MTWLMMRIQYFDIFMGSPQRICAKYVLIFRRHINPLMFGVIDDKPEGFMMYKHEPVERGFIRYHINHEQVYVL